MSRENEMKDQEFALFIEASQKAAPVPSTDLMARIYADSLDVQEANQPAQAPIVAPRPGLWQRFIDGLGGWVAVSGLATATIVGVWIGTAAELGMTGGDTGQLAENATAAVADYELAYDLSYLEVGEP